METPYMFHKEHVHAGRTLLMTVTRGKTGWEVHEERDGKVVRDTTYTDWHRVERRLHMFELATQDVQREV